MMIMISMGKQIIYLQMSTEKLFHRHVLNGDMWNIWRDFILMMISQRWKDDKEEAEPNAKASPSSLQDAADTGESKSSASSATCTDYHGLSSIIAWIIINLHD